MGSLNSGTDGRVFFGRISNMTGDILEYRASGGPANINQEVFLDTFANGDQMAVISYYNQAIDLGQADPVPTGVGIVAARIDAADDVTRLNHYHAPNPMGYALTMLAVEPTITDDFRLVGFESGPIDLGDGMVNDVSFILTVAGDGSFVAAQTYPLSLIFTGVGRAFDGVDIVGGIHTGPAEDLGGMTLPSAPGGSGFVARLAP
jgi:hypothetical protein